MTTNIPDNPGMGEEREADAWLVEWAQGSEQWVDCHADEPRARDQAKAKGGACTPLYRAALASPQADVGELVGRLHGPVQWGYMCLADGGFIADDAPVEAADLIERLTKPASGDGVVLVPREPTEAMLTAASIVVEDRKYQLIGDDVLAKAWSAMIDAATNADGGEGK